MPKYTIVHTRSIYTNVYRYEASGNVHITGYHITSVMQGHLGPMNDVYIAGNASQTSLLPTPIWCLAGAVANVADSGLYNYYIVYYKII